MPPLNPLLLDTSAPPIPAIQAWGAAYRGERGPLLNLCQAVPAHAPAPGLLDRLGTAAADPASAAYGQIPGDPALREAYAAHLSTLHGATVSPAQVAITAGCNQAYFVAMMAIAQRGDAVLLPTPWYFNHRMTLDMLGVEARPLPTRAADGFLPDPDAAEALLDHRVRAIVLVTPNNPTGAIYPPALIARFQALCRRRGLWLILDETYRDVLPPGPARPHDLPAGGGWPDGLIQLYSFSKAYAVPGHRLGALTGPAALLPEVTKVMDCVQICAARTGQAALAWGIGALDDWRAGKRDDNNRRAEAMREALGRLPGWRPDSLGAYFAYVRHPFGDAPAWRVAEHLAREHGLMCLPAPAFAGEEGHLRISFANLDAPAISGLEDRLRAAAREGMRDLAAAAGAE